MPNTAASDLNNCKDLFTCFDDKLIQEMHRRLTHIREILKGQKHATLVLGAGINRTAQLPGWDQLLNRLLFMMIHLDFPRNPAYGKEGKFDENEYTDYTKAENVYSGTDALEIGEYVYGVLRDSTKTAYKPLSPLRDNADEYLKVLVKRALMPPGRKDPFSYSALQPLTIGRIAELAYQYFTVKQEKFRRRSVITYNYDNLLEHCLSNAHPDCKTQSLYDKNPIDRDSEMHIFHPHGYLDLIHPNGEESEQIILSESSYYSMENKNYNWENFLLARALNDSTSLFFGFSGNDYNFRRILKHLDSDPNQNQKDINGFHRFIFVTVNKIRDRTMNGTSASPVKRQRFYSYLALKEAYWIQKGFLPIWTFYNDLPHVIDFLLQA